MQPARLAKVAQVFPLSAKAALGQSAPCARKPFFFRRRFGRARCAAVGRRAWFHGFGEGLGEIRGGIFHAGPELAIGLPGLTWTRRKRPTCVSQHRETWRGATELARRGKFTPCGSGRLLAGISRGPAACATTRGTLPRPALRLRHGGPTFCRRAPKTCCSRCATRRTLAPLRRSGRPAGVPLGLVAAACLCPSRRGSLPKTRPLAPKP